MGGDHLLDALINAGTPTTIDGQDPIPPIINFAELLLDESRALDRVIERARCLDPRPRMDCGDSHPARILGSAGRNETSGGIQWKVKSNSR